MRRASLALGAFLLLLQSPALAVDAKNFKIEREIKECQVQIIDINQNNKFGGSTITFRAPGLGIKEGECLMDGGNSLMEKSKTYTEGKQAITGIHSVTEDYLYNALIKREVIYTRKDSFRRRIGKTVYHFEQTTGRLQSKETHFIEKHKGYNVEHYQIGDLIDKLEWHYPDAKDGVHQKIIHFDDQGKKIAKEEILFTERHAKKEGVLKQVKLYDEKDRLSREEWYYTPEWARANQGVAKRVLSPYYHPTYKIPPRELLYDLQGELILH